MPATWKNCVPSWPPPRNSSRPVRPSTASAPEPRWDQITSGLPNAPGNCPHCGRSSPRWKPGPAAARSAARESRPGPASRCPSRSARSRRITGMPAEQDRIATLRQAAAAKRDAAVARAEAGIRALAKTGQPITFRAVAAAGGVSVDFLYRHPELRARIGRLRGHKPAPAGHAAPDRPGDRASSVVATLTARLTELRRELAETKAQLATAHGELLALRRHPGNAASSDGSGHRPSSTTLRQRRVINVVTWPFTPSKLIKVR